MTLDVNKDPQAIREMFGRIARRYDLNNRLHSLWHDQAWRRLAARAAEVRPGQAVLDAACGTGDLTAMLARAPAGRVVGMDYCQEMLDVARQKDRGSRIEWLCGDCLNLPFADGEFDAVTIAFGLRNVADPLRALAQFHRVLRPGGRLVVLEFHPTSPGTLGGLLNLYLGRIMPTTAGLIAGDKTGAYRYLWASSQGFWTMAEMADAIRAAGFADVTSRRLTLGIAALHVGVIS